MSGVFFTKSKSLNILKSLKVDKRCTDVICPKKYSIKNGRNEIKSTILNGLNVNQILFLDFINLYMYSVANIIDIIPSIKKKYFLYSTSLFPIVSNAREKTNNTVRIKIKFEIFLQKGE